MSFFKMIWSSSCILRIIAAQLYFSSSSSFFTIQPVHVGVGVGVDVCIVLHWVVLCCVTHFLMLSKRLYVEDPDVMV